MSTFFRFNLLCIAHGTPAPKHAKLTPLSCKCWEKRLLDFCVERVRYNLAGRGSVDILFMFFLPARSPTGCACIDFPPPSSYLLRLGLNSSRPPATCHHLRASNSKKKTYCLGTKTKQTTTYFTNKKEDRQGEKTRQHFPGSFFFSARLKSRLQLYNRPASDKVQATSFLQHSFIALTT